MHQNSANVDKQLEHFLLTTFMLKNSDIIMITDGGTDFTDARILGVNSSFEYVTGLSQKNLINSTCVELLDASDIQLFSLNSVFKTCSTVRHQIAVKNINGEFTPILFEIYPVQQGTSLWVWQAKSSMPKPLTNHDQQFNQQDMMRAIEKLAGQAAHDFNNILAIIMGNNDLLLENVEVSSLFHPLLCSISRAVDKGTHLTQTLLEFAQKNTLSNEELNLNDYLLSMDKELREIISPYHVLKIELCGQPCNICVDRTMLQKCISNLVLNAAQAMHEKPIEKLIEKSTIVIQINTMFVPQQKDAFDQIIVPQEYVKLTITDTGTGITITNLPLIFIPFFTTQKTKTAKGLGLSMVYGFLKKSMGYCLVDTELGKGSSFSLLFSISPH
jgi:signal transduction histidine kinase